MKLPPCKEAKSLFPDLEPGKSLFSKWCTKCGTKSTLDNFPENRDTKSGRGSICRPCLSTWNIKNNKTPKRRYARAVQRAKVKGLEWGLTFDEYQNLVSQKCEYCGGDLPTNGVGLDRLDCKLGYVSANVVPACEPCNMVRNSIFTPEEMKLFLGPAIRRIYERRISRGETIIYWRDRERRQKKESSHR